MVEDDLDHPPSPVKYILGHADNIAPELIFCPNQPFPDAEFLVCIRVRHDLREKMLSLWYVSRRILGRSMLLSTLVLKVVHRWLQ
jgi:hypothetical protein